MAVLAFLLYIKREITDAIISKIIRALTNLTILITVAKVTLPLSKRLDDESVGVVVWECERLIQSANVYPTLKDILGSPTV